MYVGMAQKQNGHMPQYIACKVIIPEYIHNNFLEPFTYYYVDA